MRKMLITKILMVACIALLSYTAAAQTGTVKGKVTGAGGALAGATVRAGSQTISTGNNGEYSFSIKPGTYNMTVSYVSHITATRLVIVKADEIQVLDFSMETGGNLDELVLIGSRSGIRRSGTQTPVPADVITAADLAATGQVEPTQMIN